MDNGFNLKRQGVLARTAQHPVGAFLGAASMAALCGFLGSAHGDVPAVVMAALGALLGAPLGSMLASTTNP